MVVTYYADVIFAWNFVVDCFLLFLIHPNIKKQYWRLILAAVLGGATTLCLLYLSSYAVLLYFVLRFLSAMVMIVIAMPVNGVGELLCNTALLYGTSGGVYGISVLISGRWEDIGRKPLALTIVSLVLMLIMKTLYRFRKRRCHHLQYQYKAVLGNGKEQTECKAFFDSGNHLIEPISGKPVILVCKRVMQKLNVNHEKMRAIPYSSLGKTAGLLEAYPIEQLTVCNEKNLYQFQNIYMAEAEETMFIQENCEVILHAGMIRPEDIRIGCM